jgi:N-methylhydantoinase A/oxoprolinase/acetone carboxylase beta subunit
MAVVSLSNLIEKTCHWDKDERFMATNDLISELAKENVRIDQLTEKRICAAVLKQLDDSSTEVQSVAVKCLSSLYKKVHEDQVEEICEKVSKR